MRRLTIVFALFLALATPLHAAEPRVVVGRVADQIAARYFDPDKGARLAADLKAEAARGDFDRYAEPLDLAQALTARLRPADGHFNVSWSSASPPRAGGPRPPPVEIDRRQAYGFRGVERLPGNVAVVTMGFFAHFERANEPAKGAADAAMALTAGADALIFDLRDNGGGSPAMVGYLAGHFVPAGANIYNTFKSRGPDEYERPPAEPLTGRQLETPLYILISGRTASAAESFAYTLQAAGRAVVVGEPSAGGANPGDVARIGDGFAVFISTGTPVNPITGGNWEGAGVQPDVLAAASEALVKAQQAALARLVESQTSEPARTEARWALEALSATAGLSSKALADYAGAYGARSVMLKDGQLLMAQGRRPPLALKPLENDVFAIDGAAVPLRVRFDRDADGRVTGMVQTSPDGRMTRYARTG